MGSGGDTLAAEDSDLDVPELAIVSQCFRRCRPLQRAFIGSIPPILIRPGRTVPATLCQYKGLSRGSSNL